MNCSKETKIIWTKYLLGFLIYISKWSYGKQTELLMLKSNSMNVITAMSHRGSQWPQKLPGRERERGAQAEHLLGARLTMQLLSLVSPQGTTLRHAPAAQLLQKRALSLRKLKEKAAHHIIYELCSLSLTSSSFPGPLIAYSLDNRKAKMKPISS